MSIRCLLAALIVFSIGIGTGALIVVQKNNKVSAEPRETRSKQIRQSEHYKYINPLLECDVADGSIDARKENFHNDLEKFVSDLKDKRGLTDIAVYFRDLNNGPTFGINEQDEFFPASLLKVPVMMAYYHWSELEPELLNTKIVYATPRNFVVRPTIMPSEELVLGQTYTINELIRRMIVYSDNQALGLLLTQVSIEKIQDLFSIIGVGNDVLINPDAKLTVKEYAGFFRILFNSSYLSRENSEKALSLLSSTDYNDALPAGVPTGISVAHKFGEAGTGDIERQLHDCGIVYFPNHPYLACIMTRGKNTDDLKQSIIDISRFIYEKIDEQY